MRAFLSVVLVVFFASSVAAQITRHVPTPLYPTIQSAIDAASFGDTVQVAAGTYFENLVFPSVNFRLLGAGRGVTIIDGSADKPCLTFHQAVSNAMVVEGFTLQNGLGKIINLGPPLGPRRAGGGIHISRLTGTSPIIEPVFRRIEITGCTADCGAAICARNARSTRFSDCDVHHNGTSPMQQSVVEFCFCQSVRFDGCVFRDHTNPSAHAPVVFIQTSPRLFDCRILRNHGMLVGAVSNAGSAPGSFAIARCQFIENNTASAYGNVLQTQDAQPLAVENCLFAKNEGGQGVVQLSGLGQQAIRNCTITDNVLANNNQAALIIVGFGRMENTISHNNRDLMGNVVRGSASMPSGNIIRRNCLNETPANAQTFIHPAYVDAAGEDYRLAPGSIGLNGGTLTFLNPPAMTSPAPTDLDGNDRVRFGAIDVGCFEAQEIAYVPAARGRVGAAAGGPFDVLHINGSTGGLFRTITMPLGSSSTVSVSQPPHLAGPAGFAVFGMTAAANENTIFDAPLGIGTMTFAPCPAAPGHPLLFTLTNNLGTICPPLVTSTPTPWTSAPFPPIFFPVTLTFQGIVEEAPGVYVPTNMVILKIE